ncbi:MAG TPA: UDP-N-acetylmuramate--L-alanine ligase [Deltaproteobacteria bacterium]|nr:UDP-N-acetylmuramate--L-alanine ligase [Deltaproteobacteria bacterium]
MFRGKVRTIHFVGIGGIGMSGIAEVLLNLGFDVSGSDLKESVAVTRLRSLGAVIHLGHDPGHVGAADVVVRSTAVDLDNPEVREALDQGVPVIRRAEMLAELMRLKYGIAVAGTHGKTTTTSMLASCLAAGGLDPTVVIGGRLDSIGSNAKLGAGEYLVAEADESDGTFNELTPTVTVVTNIDPEHLDHHGTMDHLEGAFADFANRVPFYGFSVLCLDHPRVQELMPRVRRPVVTYGFAHHADYRASPPGFDGIRSRFTVFHRGEALGEIVLGMPGRHNVQNATGAIAAALELSIPFERVQEGLHEFTGVQRRFTLVGEPGGVMLVDDYGHHPVEIEATLEAAEAAWPERRVIAVFQPHRFTRVRDLWNEFCSAFNRAGEVVVCPVYAAGEEPIEGVDHEHLAAELRDRGHRGTRAVGSLDEAVSLLTDEVTPGDIVITLGAGNVNQVVRELMERLS